MDAITRLRRYLEGDPVSIMSKARVEEIIAEIERKDAALTALREALENILTVWANKDKKRGWVDRFFEAKRRARAVLDETANEG